MINLQKNLSQWLEAYSPVAMGILIAAILLPIDWPAYRSLVLLLCAGPGIIAALIQPRTVLKNPVLILMAVFIAYFSGQQLRGLLPLSAGTLYKTMMTAIMLIGSPIILSLVSPKKKLGSIVLITSLLIACGRFIFSLIHFYADAPFPAARFSGMGHPVGCAHVAGAITVLAGAFFLQHGKQISKVQWISLLCLPIALFTALYTHTRFIFLALLCMGALSAVGMRSRLRKTFILWAVGGLCLAAYLTSMVAMPFEKPHQRTKTGYDIRTKGVFSGGKRQKKSAKARIEIWQDHFSRMDTPAMWIAGHGLGRNRFVDEVSPKAARWYYKDPEKGYLLLPHSIYIWSIYFGGVIGLALLLALYATAGWQSLRCAITHRYYVPLATLMFGAIGLLADGHTLLTNQGNITLLFWVPLGLAAGIPFRKR